MSRILKENCISIEIPSTISYENIVSSRNKKNAEQKNKAEDKPKPAAEQPKADAYANVILENAVKKADEAMEKANEDAFKIIKKARQEADEIHKSAYQDGYSDGLKSGEALAVKQEEQVVAQLKELMKRLSDSKENVEKNAYDEALDLAFTLAEKIIDIEIDKNDKAFLNICTKAAMHAGEATRAVLKVGPREYVIASKYDKEIQKCMGGLKNFEIELDQAKTGSASCVIETDSGLVDAGIFR